MFFPTSAVFIFRWWCWAFFFNLYWCIYEDQCFFEQTSAFLLCKKKNYAQKYVHVNINILMCSYILNIILVICKKKCASKERASKDFRQQCTQICASHMFNNFDIFYLHQNLCIVCTEIIKQNICASWTCCSN